MRIDRLLAITVLLLKKERVTARELAERFEVSIRTIYRDMDAMCLAGIPVLPYAGNGGGYCLMEHYKLDKRLLKSEDIRAILSTLSGINHSLGDRDIQNALDKISSLLPKGEQPTEPSLFEQLVVDLFPWNQNPVQVERIRSIHRGISECRMISFGYRNLKGEHSQRSVEPMTLVFKGYGWYLFAYCLDRQDFRFFKISRMKDITISPTQFRRRPASYETFLPPKKSEKKSCELVLDFQPQMSPFLEDTFPNEPRELLPDGRTRVTLSVSDNEWILGMILSFGPMVRVVSPEDIRKQVLDAAQKIILINQS